MPRAKRITAEQPSIASRRRQRANQLITERSDALKEAQAKVREVQANSCGCRKCMNGGVKEPLNLCAHCGEQLALEGGTAYYERWTYRDHEWPEYCARCAHYIRSDVCLKTFPMEEGLPLEES